MLMPMNGVLHPILMAADCILRVPAPARPHPAGSFSRAAGGAAPRPGGCRLLA
jgi:hypothetical protein